MTTELTKAEELINQLEGGIVVFNYKKSDGTLRRAVGTRRNDLIPRFQEEKVQELVEASMNMAGNLQRMKDNPEMFEKDPEPFWAGVEIFNSAIEPFHPREKGAYTPNEDWINYYDFEAKGWRKCKKDNII